MTTAQQKQFLLASCEKHGDGLAGISSLKEFIQIGDADFIGGLYEYFTTSNENKLGEYYKKKGNKLQFLLRTLTQKKNQLHELSDKKKDLKDMHNNPSLDFI